MKMKDHETQSSELIRNIFEAPKMIPMPVIERALDRVASDAIRMDRYGNGLIGTAVVREIFNETIENYLETKVFSLD